MGRYWFKAADASRVAELADRPERYAESVSAIVPGKGGSVTLFPGYAAYGAGLISERPKAAGEPRGCVAASERSFRNMEPLRDRVRRFLTMALLDAITCSPTCTFQALDG